MRLPGLKSLQRCNRSRIQYRPRSGQPLDFSGTPKKRTATRRMNRRNAGPRNLIPATDDATGDAYRLVAGVHSPEQTRTRPRPPTLIKLLASIDKRTHYPTGIQPRHFQNKASRVALKPQPETLKVMHLRSTGTGATHLLPTLPTTPFPRSSRGPDCRLAGVGLIPASDSPGARAGQAPHRSPHPLRSVRSPETDIAAGGESSGRCPAIHFRPTIDSRPPPALLRRCNYPHPDGQPGAPFRVLTPAAVYGIL